MPNAVFLIALVVAGANKVDPSKVAELAADAKLSPEAFVNLAKTSEEYRPQAIAATAKMISAARESGADRKRIAALVAYRKALAERKQFAFPWINFQLAKGAVGSFPCGVIKVDQVLSRTSFNGTIVYDDDLPTLIPVHYDNISRTVMVKGVDTSTLVDSDGDKWSFCFTFESFQVEGNQTYTTALGGSRTVPVLKPFNPKPLAEYMELLKGKKRRP